VGQRSPRIAMANRAGEQVQIRPLNQVRPVVVGAAFFRLLQQGNRPLAIPICGSLAPFVPVKALADSIRIAD